MSYPKLTHLCRVYVCAHAVRYGQQGYAGLVSDPLSLAGMAVALSGWSGAGDDLLGVAARAKLLSGARWPAVCARRVDSNTGCRYPRRYGHSARGNGEMVSGVVLHRTGPRATSELCRLSVESAYTCVRDGAS